MSFKTKLQSVEENYFLPNSYAKEKSVSLLNTLNSSELLNNNNGITSNFENNNSNHKDLITSNTNNGAGYCYINESKFGEISGCENDPMLRRPKISNKFIKNVSDLSFASKILNKNTYNISQTPSIHEDNLNYINKIGLVDDFTENNLYDLYCKKKYKDKISNYNINGKFYQL